MRDAVVLTGTRVIPAVAGPGIPTGPVDVRVESGRVAAVGTELDRAGAEVHDAAGTFVLPGLWDAHVHMGQWAAAGRRLDLTGTDGPAAVTARVAEHVPAEGGDPGHLVEGYGWRLGEWSREPSTAELDAVVGERPVVLVSGDCHAGWLSTAAYRALGMTPRPGHVAEDEWFALWGRLAEIPHDEVAARAALADRCAEAAAKGVVGIVDLEAGDTRREWVRRSGDGLDLIRVRPAVYRDRLDDALADGVRTGDVLDAAGLVTMGPFKVITDGSLGTRTAWCCEPYAGVTGEPSYGVSNVDVDELTELMRRARSGGLEAAAHAIGDRALGEVLTAFERSGARGTVEHAQLARRDDAPRMARLGVAASVQPAHLLDDRDATEALWPGRADRCFPLRSLHDAGVELRLGSDAPVAPLDPWLAMAASVHRSADERDPWTPEQALTPTEALLASVDGQRVAPGARGDLVLLAEDPFVPVDAADLADPTATAGAADRLRATRPVATLVGGRFTHAT